MKSFRFLVYWLLLAMLAVALAACGGGSGQEEANSAESPVSSNADAAALCGDKAQLASELHFFNWSDYFDPAIADQFEALCGVKVTEDYFSSNEDMIAKIQAGNSGYDLIVPSDYAVDILIRRGLLHELNRDNIPNIANLNPEQMGLYYDPSNTYSLPYQYGVTGIAYNTAYYDAPPDSWAALLEPDQVCQHKGFALMLDDEREAIGATLKYLGYSYNDTDPAHQAEALAKLQAQKDCLAGYNSDNYIQMLVSEEVVIAHTWTGGAALARSENENVAFVVPKEGGAIWQDNLAIPIDAPNSYTAEIFINYLLTPEVGAQLSNYIYYFTPNKAAEPLLDEEYFQILESGGMLIDETTRQRLEWIERNDQTVIFSDTWTAVKAK